MPEKKLPRVGERVNVEGRDGVFFLLKCDEEARTVSLLPSDDGRILDNVAVDSLAIIPRPDPNGATRAWQVLGARWIEWAQASEVREAFVRMAEQIVRSPGGSD